MSALATSPPRPLPRWLMVTCSGLAFAHLLLIGLFSMAANSGPWPVPPPFGGESFVDGPSFATAISSNFTYPYYLKPLRMTHNYHFATNRTPTMAVYFEAHLKDEFGKLTILKFPDDKASFWVRHRQEILAQNLAQDQRMAPRGNQQVAAKDKDLPKVEIWTREGPWTMKLKMVDELEIAPNLQTEQPSPWSKAVSQSYARYLTRQHKAVSVELIRYSRPTVLPMMMFLPELQIKDSFTELKSHFGEYRRE